MFGFDQYFTSWIKILLGNTSGGGFKGVDVVNGHISGQIPLQHGCRQSDPIAGYLFGMCIEVLVLLIENSKVEPYLTIGLNPISMIPALMISHFISSIEGMTKTSTIKMSNYSLIDSAYSKDGEDLL